MKSLVDRLRFAARHGHHFSQVELDAADEIEAMGPVIYAAREFVNKGGDKYPALVKALDVYDGNAALDELVAESERLGLYNYNDEKEEDHGVKKD